MKKQNIFSLIFAAVLAAAFVYSLCTYDYTLPGFTSAVLISVLMALSLWRFGASLYALPETGGESGRTEQKKTFMLLLAMLLFRVLVLVAVSLVMPAERAWFKGDASHYLGIAKNGYVTEGDPRFHIVFFPFYPLVMRLFSYIFGYLGSALFVSNVCAVLGGYGFYRLLLLDMPERIARRSVKFLFILPAAFFLGAAMSESLFFMLTVAALYALRKERFLLAGLFGLLSALTRSLGAILVVPIFIEWLKAVVKTPREERWGKTLRYSFAALMTAAGLGIYLLINYLVTGDAFRFMYYQRTHWYQGFGLFFETAAYQTKYLLEENSPLFLWLPNLIYIFASLALIFAAQKKLPLSYTGYFLAYFVVSVGATWLLSAPRYLTCAYPLPLALAILTEKKWANIAATVLCLLGFALYLAAYLAGASVY